MAADFWVTKNVSGRLLVGLRWWHYVKDDGSNVWVFESAKKQGTLVNSVEGIIFWGTMVGAVPLWVILGIVAIFDLSFTWLFVIGLAIALLVANIFGYAKCIKDKKQQLKSIATGYITKKVIEKSLNSETDSGFPI